MDEKTELPVCMELKQGDKTTVCPSFFHNGVKIDLRFENNVLVGARRSYSEEKEALAAELGASWDTDPEILKLILEDYAAQVHALSSTAHLEN